MNGHQERGRRSALRRMVARRREVEASRRHLVDAITTAQQALLDVATRAAEHDALLGRYRLRGLDGELAVDAEVLLASIAYDVAATVSGDGGRLVAHLRYFAGRRFLVERCDGLLVGVPRVRGEGPAP